MDVLEGDIPLDIVFVSDQVPAPVPFLLPSLMLPGPPLLLPYDGHDGADDEDSHDVVKTLPSPTSSSPPLLLLGFQ